MRQNPQFSPHAELCYEHRGLLGEGGMGSVTRVFDKRLQREAALKLVRSECLDDLDLLERFAREAKITAGLNHPSIPPIFEFGLTSDKQYFMLMPVIEGETFEAMLNQGALELKEALNILIKVSEAVAYAHSRGILHRDLKPENIMVGQFGEVMVMDWGLARDLKDAHDHDPILSKVKLDSVSLTQHGSVLGTPGYMSPEQASAETLDQRTDVFSLGAILMRVLTGQPPAAEGNALKRVMDTASGKIKRPHELNPEVDTELNSLTCAALAIDPKQRLASAEEFTDELQRFVAGELLHAHQYTLLERCRRFASRHALGLVMLLILSLSLTLAALLWGERQRALAERHKRERSEQVARKAKNQAKRARKQVKDTRQARKEERVARLKVERLLDNLIVFEDTARRGSSRKKIERRGQQLMEAGSQSKTLALKIARVYMDCDYPDLARALLEETVKAMDDSEPMEAIDFRVLFFLHELESPRTFGHLFDMTPALQRLIDRAQTQQLKNEFTLYAEALMCLREQRATQAIQALSQCLRKAPSNVWFQFCLGCAYLKMRQNQSAVRAFNQALELDPNHALGLVFRAKAHLLKGDFEAANTDAQRAITLAPKNLQVIFSRAEVLIGIDHHQVARREINRALKNHPKHPFLLHLLARLDIDLGRYQQAQATLEEIMRGPTIPRKSHELLRELKSAIQKGPEFLRRQQYTRWYRSGANAYNKGSFGKALRHLSSAIEALPEQPEAHSLKACALFMKGAQDQAAGAFDTALKLTKNDKQRANVHFNRATMYALKKQHTHALKDFNQVLQYRPNLAKAYGHRGVCYQELKLTQLALNDFNQSLKLAPDDNQILYLRAVLYYKVKKYKPALTDIDQLINRVKRASDFHYILRGKCHRALKQLDKARVDFQYTLKTFPKCNERRRIQRWVRELEAERRKQ